MQQPIVDLLVWLRVPGDTIFAVGALLLAWFIASLWLRPRREPYAVDAEGEAAAGDSGAARAA
jgi:nitric oxide reductase subunit B